eukprot:scaffold156973_cov31-Tisochrysis_lutea.AAC.2
MASLPSVAAPAPALGSRASLSSTLEGLLSCALPSFWEALPSAALAAVGSRCALVAFGGAPGRTGCPTGLAASPSSSHLAAQRHRSKVSGRTARCMPDSRARKSRRARSLVIARAVAISSLSAESGGNSLAVSGRIVCAHFGRGACTSHRMGTRLRRPATTLARAPAPVGWAAVCS